MISNILSIVLIVFSCVFAGLLCVLLQLIIQDQKRKANFINDKPKKVENTTSATTGYSAQAISKFMEFDSIIDNMIIQKNGMRYIMVLQCQGINYDLMSGMEKASVERGFLGFLNTLKSPIQLYIQSRTVNLESSIGNYKHNVDEIEKKYKRMQVEYDQNKESGLFSNEELQRDFYELTKLKNLYEYGKDVVFNTEQMSQNKNVLNKQYYIVLSYVPEELKGGAFDKEEIRNMAFSELYTKAQSVLYSLSSTGVTGKILSSYDLVELLYMAYNREDAEIYGIDKAIMAEYDSLYSTAPYVIDKMIEELDKEIQRKALDKAELAILKYRSKKEEKLAEKIEAEDDFIEKLAKDLLDENSIFIGDDMAEGAKNVIDEERKLRTKEESNNEKQRRRNSTRK